MRLRDYRKIKGLTLNQVAESIGVKSRMTISRYEREPSDPNFRMPDRDVMKRIAAWSAGAVTPNDFYDVAPCMAAPAEVSA